MSVIHDQKRNFFLKKHLVHLWSYKLPNFVCTLNILFGRICSQYKYLKMFIGKGASFDLDALNDASSDTRRFSTVPLELCPWLSDLMKIEIGWIDTTCKKHFTLFIIKNQSIVLVNNFFFFNRVLWNLLKILVTWFVWNHQYFEKFATKKKRGGGGPQEFYHRFMYIAPSQW